MVVTLPSNVSGLALWISRLAAEKVPRLVIWLASPSVVAPADAPLSVPTVMIEPVVWEMVLPEFSDSLFAEPGLIVPTMLMAPLLASPITIVLAVMLSSSASLRSRLVGKVPPSAIGLPAVA
ncbi:hypothetical protein RLIN73S_02216 [Rhodanobacter lindaniclasticus]